ncbi:MAG: hypothetical protein BAJATHORv1_50194 [Candidatus Thorarchaeota archaeon]|nr:MAG: hypothetical protein BAJATHORv1_50194 [Candidatus Thorarchaeota archaeon]
MMKDDKRLVLYIVLIVLLAILFITGIFPIDSISIGIIPGLVMLLIFEYLFHGLKPPNDDRELHE